MADCQIYISVPLTLSHLNSGLNLAVERPRRRLESKKRKKRGRRFQVLFRKTIMDLFLSKVMESSFYSVKKVTISFSMNLALFCRACYWQNTSGALNCHFICDIEKDPLNLFLNKEETSKRTFSLFYLFICPFNHAHVIQLLWRPNFGMLWILYQLGVTVLR